MESHGDEKKIDRAAARLGSLLTKRGVDDDTIDAVLYRNAAARFRFSPDR